MPILRKARGRRLMNRLRHNARDRRNGTLMSDTYAKCSRVMALLPLFVLGACSGSGGGSQNFLDQIGQSAGQVKEMIGNALPQNPGSGVGGLFGQSPDRSTSPPATDSGRGAASGDDVQNASYVSKRSCHNFYDQSYPTWVQPCINCVDQGKQFGSGEWSQCMRPWTYSPTGRARGLTPVH